MPRRKPDPDELPVLRDLEPFGATLTELEEREEELSSACSDAHAEAKQEERKYVEIRNADFDVEGVAERFLEGDEPDMEEADYRTHIDRAKKAKRRARALSLAKSKVQKRQKKILRSSSAAEALADAWRDDVEANAAEIGSLARRLWERLEIHDRMRRKFFADVGVNWNPLPFFPPPGGGPSRIGTGKRAPDLPDLLDRCVDLEIIDPEADPR